MTSQNDQSGPTLKHPLIPLGVAEALPDLLAEVEHHLRQGLAGRPHLEVTARVLLAELDHCVELACDRGRQVPAARWELLVRELQRLKRKFEARP
jgi:hypothetical protein